jgi:hypothetical protein
MGKRMPLIAKDISLLRSSKSLKQSCDYDQLEADNFGSGQRQTYNSAM